MTTLENWHCQTKSTPCLPIPPAEFLSPAFHCQSTDTQSVSLKPELKLSSRTGVIIRSIWKVLAMNKGHGEMQRQGPELKHSPLIQDGPKDISPPWLKQLISFHPDPSFEASPSVSILGHRTDKSSWSWVLIQDPMSLTGKHSGLQIVFDEFDLSKPTSLRNLMTSDQCYDLFHRIFLIAASINIS